MHFQEADVLQIPKISPTGLHILIKNFINLKTYREMNSS